VSLASLSSLSSAASELVAVIAPAIVSITTKRSRSSGIVWRPGLIVTADDALDDGPIAVRQHERTYAGELVGRDPATDIAVLRIDAPALPAAALTAAPTRAGAVALAVGARDGYPIVALGLVASSGPAWRSMRGGAIDARIDLDLSLRREAQGGLVVDADGAGLGMAVFAPNRRAMVIPSATIERVAQVLEVRGRVPRGYLGLALKPVRLDGADAPAAMVMHVEADGPGAKAGVRQGDLIETWDGQPIPGIGALLRSLGPESIGTVAELGVRRSGMATAIPLTIGERPAA